MYGFIIKKSFCDDWDNLLTVILVNVLYLITGVSTILGVLKLGELFSNIGNNIETYQIVLIFLSIFVIFYLLNIIAFAWGENACKYADFDSANILDFFKEIPGVLIDALLFTILVSAILCFSVFSIWFYCFASGSQIGFFVGALLFWLDIFIILSLQWFIPLRSMFHNKFLKCLKKCFLIFFDNTGYSICVFLHTILLIVISVFPFIGFFPSIAGIGISKANALRIRMYKYDYLEEHPELQTKRQRNKIPWEELIYEDRETLGPRKLKSFLFPWKDDK